MKDINELEDNTIITTEINFNGGTRFFAQINSYLFHPLFVPLYVTFFLLYIHPNAFIGFSDLNRMQVILIVTINVLFFPLISVLLLKAVGFIDSIYLRTQKDRIIPYMACGIFFFWAFNVFKQQTQYPSIFVVYLLGLFLASSAALIANIYFKVSMHAIGMGGWLGLFLLICYSQNILMTWPLSLVLLLTGMVCTSRMILKSHTPLDIYSGLFIGIVTQMISFYFLG